MRSRAIVDEFGNVYRENSRTERLRLEKRRAESEARVNTDEGIINEVTQEEDTQHEPLHVTVDHKGIRPYNAQTDAIFSLPEEHVVALRTFSPESQ